MKNPRIYCPSDLSIGEETLLPEGATHHVLKVLRMKQGDTLRLFNEQQGELQGSISQANKKQAWVTLTDNITQATESPIQSTIGLVMSKGDRMEWAIQKATELGMHRLVPLTSERCEIKLTGERAEKKRQHWQQVAISACEQCGLNRVPSIEAIESVSDFVQREADLKLVLHHRCDLDLSDHPAPGSILALIGPEGGLTAEEIQLAEEQGFHPLRLGPRVLRTETAPTVLLSAVQLLWGDFS